MPSPARPRAAARWTQTVLDDTARSFLDTLKPQAVAPGAELFHGSPRDPVWDYVLDDEAAAWSFAATSEPLVLVGHSHIALEISDGENLRGEPAAAGTTVELGPLRRLLNPGSVGQPRNGDARAAWLEVDFGAAPGNLSPYDLFGRADAGGDARGGSTRDSCAAPRVRHLARPQMRGAG